MEAGCTNVFSFSVFGQCCNRPDELSPPSRDRIKEVKASRTSSNDLVSLQFDELGAHQRIAPAPAPFKLQPRASARVAKSLSRSDALQPVAKWQLSSRGAEYVESTFSSLEEGRIPAASMACVPSSPAAQEQQSFAPGQRVSIQRLANHKDFNGLMGVLQELSPSSGRWLVRDDDGQEFNVKPENLVPQQEDYGDWYALYDTKGLDLARQGAWLRSSGGEPSSEAWELRLPAGQRGSGRPLLPRAKADCPRADDRGGAKGSEPSVEPKFETLTSSSQIASALGIDGHSDGASLDEALARGGLKVLGRVRSWRAFYRAGPPGSRDALLALEMERTQLDPSSGEPAAVALALSSPRMRDAFSPAALRLWAPAGVASEKLAEDFLAAHGGLEVIPEAGGSTLTRCLRACRPSLLRCLDSDGAALDESKVW